MYLITYEIQRAFKAYRKKYPNLHASSNDPLVICKIQDPLSDKTWYIIYYNLRQATVICFRTGFKDKDNGWKEISLVELEAFHRLGSRRLELDPEWEERGFRR